MRQKTVFTNSQCAHVWASQTQETGRNSSGSMFFSGDEIFSYGSHYMIAKIYGDVVLINNHTYSSTTGGHTWHVRHAVAHKPTYRVSQPDNPLVSIQDLGNDLIERLYDALLQNRPWLGIERLDGYFDDHNKLCDAFNRPDLHLSIPSELRGLLDEHLKYRTERNAELDRKRNIQRRIATVKSKYTVNIKVSQALVHDRLSDKRQIQDWLRGNILHCPCTGTDLIRVKDTVVETTGGAEVPLHHALKLLRAIDLGVNVIGQRVGHFTVDEIDGKTITIGCHTLNIGQCRYVLRQYNTPHLKAV